MSELNLRPANVAAAALVIGGVLLVALPRYALAIIQLVVVTAAAATALHALAANVPPTGWMSPFKWMSPFVGTASPIRATSVSGDIATIRAKLAGRRVRTAHGPALPPETLRLLRPLVRSALDLDPDDASPPSAAVARLSPLTASVLTTRIPAAPGWLGTLRPDERAVGETVHRILDELDRLDPGGARASTTLPPHEPRVP